MKKNNKKITKALSKKYNPDLSIVKSKKWRGLKNIILTPSTA